MTGNTSKGYFLALFADLTWRRSFDGNEKVFSLQLIPKYVQGYYLGSFTKYNVLCNPLYTETKGKYSGRTLQITIILKCL